MKCKQAKKEKHSSACDNCGEKLDTPYLGDILDWIKSADLDSNMCDVRIRCPNCSEGWVWLRLRVEVIEDA
jgi:hypothetical protein